MGRLMVVSQFQGALLGVKIGDALGLPWELFTRQRILEETDGQGVTGFGDVAERCFKEVRHLPLGASSDDWQLTAAIGRSLIRCRKFDLQDIAREHVAQMRVSTAGWGKSTRQSVQEIAEWFDSSGLRGRDPQRPATAKPGTGNGVAMKITALGLSQTMATDPEVQEFWHNIFSLGQMTHSDPRASLAAMLIAFLVGRSVKDPFLPEIQDKQVVKLCEILSEFTWEIEDHFGVKWVLAADTLTARLRRVCLPGFLTQDPASLAAAVGTSCFCIESVPFAIATFLRHPTDFRAGVLEAINAGGDTDSNAAMVGALIGANVGLGGIPEEWRGFHPDFTEAVELAMELYRVFG
ncbi:ADP-ribosylglycohydrolase family protein [Candidatus Uhrbacteria bacterium]|nr:ADP-ribosylglycohydrolase family protein [Candidatus Uhrbacteria bacterium]